LHVDSEPPAARVVLDGSNVGTTPLTASVLPGRHDLALERTDILDFEQRIEVPSTGLAVNSALWRREPSILKLRPAYPGAAIEEAQFLTDGRIAVKQHLSKLEWRPDPSRPPERVRVRCY
jgi:hypothetical protein